LSYKEQRELTDIEPAILATEAQVAELEAQLHDPAIAADHRALRDVATRLSEAQAKVAALYERWAALEKIQSGE
jgi:hypothetical protein